MNKNMQVQIKDYQIIKKMSLEFVPGLNVIVGPSNNGKSSILKAIKAATFTVPGTSPIRFGQSNYTVGIQYNGHIVILQKGLKESLYIVDGEKYSKFGQSTPEIVANSLNIKELVLNGNKEQLNFWDQMNYPFLLDKTSVEMFRFIIDSGENDKLSEVLKSMVSDRQNINKSIDMLQGSINTIDLDIENYNNELKEAKPIIDACSGIINLQSDVSKYNLLKNIKEQISKILSNKEQIENDYKKSFVRYTSCKALNNSIIDLNDKHNLLSGYHIKLKNIKDDLFDIKDILNSLKVYKLGTNQNDQDLFKLKEIRDKINYISEQKKSLKLNPVTHINANRDNIMRIIELKSYSLKHDEISHDLDTAYNNLNDYTLYLDRQKEFKSYFKICPYCGNPIHD